MNIRYPLEPVSTIRMAAKRSLRDTMQEARSVSEPMRQKRGSWGLLRQVPALLLALLFVAGCGQKGPLYLPGDPSIIKTDVPSQDESRTEQDADEDDEKDSPDNN